jgi:hypothetical protein
MRLAEKAHRERQAPGRSDLLARVCERFEIVADLLDVGIGSCARRFALLGLEGEEVHEGRLRPLDLGGQDRFLADERIDEPVERRDHLACELQSKEGLPGGVMKTLVDEDRRLPGGGAHGE